MRKGLLVFGILLGLSLFPTILANSVDSEMQKITHYAEDYETGNIDYIRLMLHLSSARGGLNEILGATRKEMGGIVKQDKLTEVLGEPNEKTRWVWVEGEEHDMKLDEAVPVWKKIVFDGKKIQIRIEAFPNIFKKKMFDDEFKGDDEEKFKEEPPEEGSIIYRLNFGVEFKKPEEQLDIQGRIDEIQVLAESGASMETLAKESVGAEMIFNNYFRQGQGKCEDIMKSIFGSENQRQTQQILLNEITFCEGEKFEAILRLEMCDECEWNYINTDLRIESRGNFNPGDKNDFSGGEDYKNLDSKDFQAKIISTISEMQGLCQEENLGSLFSLANKLRMLNEAWNQKANNVEEPMEKSSNSGRTIEKGKTVENNNQERTIVENQVSNEDNQNNVVVETNDEGSISDNTITENIITGSFLTGKVIGTGITISEKNEQSEESKDPYYWIKQDQLRRQVANSLRKANYEERKAFYLNLFSGYDKEEYYFEQTDFEKRLVEEFREKGEEICNNNMDDNNNEQIDCDDSQCGGKVCGKGTISNSNETKEVDFHCIAGTCQAKEEIIQVKGTICGNHICEGNETIDNCAEDCVLCPQYAPIKCNGRVIFSGVDKNNCSLTPTCIEEQICSANEDCRFLCGGGECVEGKCQVKGLGKCSEQECSDGTQKTMNCESGEIIISSICSNRLWTNTGLACIGISEEETTEEVAVVEIGGNQCISLADCGGENDVCSNGQCVTLPKRIDVVEESEDNIIEESESNEIGEEEISSEIEDTPTGEISQSEPEPQEGQDLEPETETSEGVEITGNVIFRFFGGLFSKIRITGGVVDEGGENVIVDGSATEDSSSDYNNNDNLPSDEVVIDNSTTDNSRSPDNQQPMGNQYENEWNDDSVNQKEMERNQEKQRERCGVDCARPCVDKCIREVCGNEMDCDIDKESKSCEGSCSADKSCIENCMSGDENWWQEEFQDEHKEEKGVFQVGGGCRTEKGRTNGYIWFGGWGEPYSQIELLKRKYYEFGNDDWCKYEVENLIKQRAEIEKGFNQEFAVWFFEEYLPNSAEEWEQSISGIFELYWHNVENQMMLAQNIQCLKKNNINDVMNVTLISIKYETEYGKLEYWEEIKEVKMPGMDKKVTIISPYMKVWIFPSREFMIYEMKKSMEEHEFPGSPEDKMERGNQEGLTEEEKVMIRQDNKFMKNIAKIADRFGGNANVVLQLINYQDSEEEIIFNIHTQVNEKDILKMEPMLPEEMPKEDIIVKIDFEKIYNFIYMSEKEMQGTYIESPPWDEKRGKEGFFKGIKNNVKQYFKVKAIIKSVEVEPKEFKDQAQSLIKSFMKKMGKGEDDKMKSEEEQGDEEKVGSRNQQIMTGKVIIPAF
jgi:hypothetical protein